MIQFEVNSDGQIISAKGDGIDELYLLSAEELSGLPYAILDGEPLHEGVHTRFVHRRTGDVTPVQMAVFKSKGGFMLWVEPLLGEKRDRLRLNYLETLFRSMACVAEYGDPELSAHLERVATYTRFFAEGVLHWTPVDVKRLEIAALVHDVGKTAIPRELLLKPGVFLHEERRYMQQHTERGERIISDLLKQFPPDDAWMVDERLFSFAKDVAMYHHENVDGSGYPTGRSGENIPLVARVVKIVDVIDALLTYRIYKISWPWEKVRDELVRLSGKEFDATLVNGLLEQEYGFVKLMESEKSLLPSELPL